MGGALAGSVGFAAEWGWTHLVFRLPWQADLLPEGLIVAIVAGTIQLGVVLIVGGLTFGVAWWLFREAFKRRSGGLGFR